MSENLEDTRTDAAPAPEAPRSPAHAPRAPRRRRGLVAAGVIVAVLAVAGAGMWAWHETPAFCGAICHAPMDAYLDTYDNGTTDKFGNALDDTARTSMLSYAHKGYDHTTCLDCHVPVLDQQISEGMEWVSGTYAVIPRDDGMNYLRSRTLAELTEASGVDEEAFCLNESCHPATPDREALAKWTECFGSPYNPHLTRHGEVDCGTCHKGHSQSVNYCTECHPSAPVPEGWLTMAQAREMGIVE